MQILTSLLLTSVLLPAPAPPADALVWAPAEGTRLQRTITSDLETVTEEAVLNMSGDERDTGSGMEIRNGQTVKIVDTFGAPSGDGAPESLQRLFDTVTQEVDSSGAPEGVLVRGSESGSSPLEGLSVDFTRDGETGAYEPAWGEDSEGEGEWLAGLQADMDGAALLPANEVSEGDSWDVDLAAAADLLWPGGELFVEQGQGDDPDVPEGGIVVRVPNAGSVRRLDELKGGLSARYAGQRDLEGRSVGVIELELKLEGELDIAEYLQDKSPNDQPYELAVLGLTYGGKGELLWDLEGNHMASLQFEAVVESETEAEWTVGNDDFSIELGFEGADTRSLAVDIRVERLAPE